MILDLIILICFLVPIPILYILISKRQSPYTAISYATLSGMLGILIIFVAYYIMGQSLGSQIEKSIDSAVNLIVSNEEAMKTLGLESLKNGEAVSSLKTIYSSIASLLPSVLMIMTAVISYIEYNILIKIRYSKNNGYKPYAYLRNFNLKNTDVLGWFMIYFLAYLLQIFGLAVAKSVVININILVEMIVSLQGISFIFLYFKIKGRSKLIPILLVVVALLVPTGNTVLFMMGIIDLIFNLKRRLISEK